MLIKEQFWYYTKEIENTFCEKIIEHSLSKESVKGSVSIVESDKPLDKMSFGIHETRNSNITWLNDQFLYDKFVPYIQGANENAGWNFEIDWYESIQFTIYKEGQHYDWHQDSFVVPFTSENKNTNGKIRKISLVCSLSNPDDYVGGDFQMNIKLDVNNNKTVTLKEIKEKGSILVFPSHQWHRVTPVVKGTRYSIVMWAIGKPFK
jgi:PKHD-type hydroxylase